MVLGKLNIDGGWTANYVGCFDDIEFFECCQSYANPRQCRVFHHTSDLWLVDGGEASKYVEVNHSLQDTQLMIYSVGNDIYLTGPNDFLITGETPHRILKVGDSAMAMPLDI